MKYQEIRVRLHVGAKMLKLSRIGQAMALKAEISRMADKMVERYELDSPGSDVRITLSMRYAETASAAGSEPDDE